MCNFTVTVPRYYIGLPIKTSQVDVPLIPYIRTVIAYSGSGYKGPSGAYLSPTIIVGNLDTCTVPLIKNSQSGPRGFGSTSNREKDLFLAIVVKAGYYKAGD